MGILRPEDSSRQESENRGGWPARCAHRDSLFPGGLGIDVGFSVSLTACILGPEISFVHLRTSIEGREVYAVQRCGPRKP